MKKISIILSIFTVLVLSNIAFAQENTNTEPINCFDYYRFGSVYASLETKNYKNSSGTKMNFFGEIKNENNYPVVDGKLYVKIMRENDSYEKTNGQDEIDSFVVRENISIPANSSIPIDFEWQVPAFAISGNYQVSTYFLIDNSFNMSGLTFTTDVVGGVVKFEVVGEQKESVYFDRAKMTLNDNPYYTVTFTPSVSATSSANISLTLTNSTNNTQRVPVILELYKWDAQSNKNLIDTKETTYLVDANSSIQIPYIVTDTKHSVYYLLAKANYRDAKSEVSVRFSREGAQEPRINFSTFQTYPFVKDQENALITCVHNTNKVDVEYGKVVTSVLDHQGNVIHTSTYEGKITGAIQGIISKFTPYANYKDLTIETIVYDKNENIIDQTSVDYVCSSLSDDCREPNVFFSLNTLITLLIIIIIIVGIILLKKHLKKKDMIVVFMLPFIIGCFLMPNTGEAKSAFWSDQADVGIAPNWFSNCIGGGACGYGGSNLPAGSGLLNGIQMQITYHAKVFKVQNGIETLLPEGSTVQIGDILRFYNSVGNYLDIFWTGYSYETDTPYGAWIPNADYVIPSNISVANMTLPGYDPGDGVWPEVYALFSVNPPSFSLSQTNYLNCNFSASNYIDCTVLNPNTGNTNLVSITPNFNYGSTYGKFYFPRLGQTKNLQNDIGRVIVQEWYEQTQCWYSSSGGPQPCSLWYWKSAYGDIFNQPISAVNIPYNLKIQPTVVACVEQNTPIKPDINVPSTGTVGTNYTFSITPVTASTTYQINWGSGAGWESVSNPNNISKTWSATGTLNIKVKATNTSSLCATESDLKTITISESEGPSSPLVLTASASCGNVSLNWNNNGATSYEVYRKLSTESSFTKIAESITDTNYSDTAISNDNQYAYKVLSIKNNNYVDSDIKSATPTCPTCDPDTKPEPLPDAPPFCYAPVACNLSVTPPQWRQNPYTCSETDTNPSVENFSFSPNIVSSGQSCPLYLKVVNVSQCYLKNRANIQVGPIFTADSITNSIEIDGTEKYIVGTYKLWCTALSDLINFQLQPLSPRSCFSVSEVKELEVQ